MTETTTDLFGASPQQLGLDLDDSENCQSLEPSQDEVRRELNEILAQAKAAQTQCPWDSRTLKYHKVVFPQMANWLPDDERDQLRIEFKIEVTRIESLLSH